MTALSEVEVSHVAHSAGVIPKKMDKELKAIAGSLDAALTVLKTLEQQEAQRWVQGNLTQIVKKIEENLS